jgi:hypothetical protein
MGRVTSWVPGIVAVAENVGGGGLGSSDGPLRNFDVPAHDYQDIVGHREANRIRFQGKRGKEVMFHFPVPTPPYNISDSIPAHERARLTRAFVLWRADGGTRVWHIDGWDGARAQLVNADVIDEDMHVPGADGIFDGSGTQPGSDPKLVDDVNSFSPLSEGDNKFPRVFYGLTLSVRVKFSPDNDNGTITFTSAGADFEAPV